MPQVQRLLERPGAAPLIREFSHAAVAATLRAILDHIRATLRDAAAPEIPAPEAMLARAGEMLREARRPVLRRVVNATGILLHTNLGRAPLAPEAVAAAAEAGRGYSNLEFDLAAGARGSRMQGVEPLLRQLTGAEAALVLNNNAAAVLLALSGLAAGGEVIVSRGELVEIGGGFRIPDVIRQGGARLVEVGSTNKTRLADYRAAITPETRVLLKVHRSNFRILGFSAEASVAELATLARAHGLLVMEDLGSGTLADLRPLGHRHEPTVPECLVAGADLVAFSGDKLLGGPQAGVLVGRHAAIDPLRRHPLLRAMRLDKMTLAALEATLRLHRDAPQRLPVLRMLGQGEAELRARAERLAGLLAGAAEAIVVASEGHAGGGALPGEGVASQAVSLAVPGLAAEELARRLRLQQPAVIGRIAAGRLLLDMLAVSEDEVPEIAGAVRAAGEPA
ncbi:L-seryl-tRNA(Sec) selenium transferase [Roseomonas sp. M0104]|uniref:L-seryl-tRNA(Sec) selenium transferase n=1 Tax=Teichococcus coralli TaxID=2545983 RepID=A0A845BPX6_9PROT|nr:L-seryl-tRNA(Sec) selenium transferase [Pseudoroseomonas coralli]MXP65459.1 L-seryl-tRNA(Sec) selenium transferase [Pseudoroseomonas coralli]